MGGIIRRPNISGLAPARSLPYPPSVCHDETHGDDERGSAPPGRLLLDGVRPARGVPLLRGRPRCPRRGLHEVGGGPRPARRRRRAALGAGLYRAADRPRRLPDRRVARSPADLPHGHRRPRPRAHQQPRGRAAACGAWAGTRSRRSSCSSPWTRGTAGSPAVSTTRARIAGSPRRCCSASAACARCGRCTCPSSLYHFNEGHAVFAGIELIADRMEAGATFETGLAGGAGAASCSPPTRRCPRATRCTRSPICAGSARAASWWTARCARSAATRST